MLNSNLWKKCYFAKFEEVRNKKKITSVKVCKQLIITKENDKDEIWGEIINLNSNNLVSDSLSN